MGVKIKGIPNTSPPFCQSSTKGQSKNKTINFSPPFCSKQRINKGVKNNKCNVLPLFVKKTKNDVNKG